MELEKAMIARSDASRILAALERQIERLPWDSWDATLLAQAFLIIKRKVVTEGGSVSDTSSA